MKNMLFQFRTHRWGMGVVLGLLALLVAGVGACAGPTNVNPTVGSAISVSGHLTRKGSEPATWWAVTDDQGQVWRVKAPTAEQNTLLEKSQNKRIKLDGVVQEQFLNQRQINIQTINIF